MRDKFESESHSLLKGSGPGSEQPEHYISESLKQALHAELQKAQQSLEDADLEKRKLIIENNRLQDELGAARSARGRQTHLSQGVKPGTTTNAGEEKEVVTPVNEFFAMINSKAKGN